MVKAQLPIFVALLLLTPSISSAVIVYNNLGGPFEAVHGGGVTELGDQVLLGGTERILTEIFIEFRGDFLDHGLDGDEFVSIQFYYNDGVAGAPSSMFYQSPLIPVLSPTGTVGPQVFNDIIAWTLPNILAPDSFTWSIKRFGMTAGGTDQVGLYAGGDPSVGASGDFIWFNNVGSGWIQSDLGATITSNYHAMIEAQDDPVDETAITWGAAKSTYR